MCTHLKPKMWVKTHYKWIFFWLVSKSQSWPVNLLWPTSLILQKRLNSFPRAQGPRPGKWASWSIGTHRPECGEGVIFSDKSQIMEQVVTMFSWWWGYYQFKAQAILSLLHKCLLTSAWLIVGKVVLSATFLIRRMFIRVDGLSRGGLWNYFWACRQCRLTACAVKTSDVKLGPASKWA